MFRYSVRMKVEGNTWEELPQSRSELLAASQHFDAVVSGLYQHESGVRRCPSSPNLHYIFLARQCYKTFRAMCKLVGWRPIQGVPPFASHPKSASMDSGASAIVVRINGTKKTIGWMDVYTPEIMLDFSRH